MDLNIALQTAFEIDRMILPDLIWATGWKQIDSAALEAPESKKGHVKVLVVYPHIVHYTIDRMSFSEIWYKCRIETTDPVEPIIEWFNQEVFAKLRYKPFKDEDAKGGHFSLKESGEFHHLSFFVNPSYPEGRWSNHAIEGE